MFLLSLLVLALCQSICMAAVKTETITYKVGEKTYKGVLAYDDAAKGKLPGILVVHEFWGLNDYARNRARMLAELGYVALAIDMYGDGKVATHPKDATGFANAVNSNIPEARRRFQGAMTFLQSQPEVDPAKIAAIGYCFGGGIVLQMAVDNTPGLAAVVSFHGPLSISPSGGTITPKILVCHGAEDAFSTPEMVADFQSNFKAANADLTFITYPGAKHSFTNPDSDKLGQEFNLPIAYNATADKQSWGELKKFLQTVFPPSAPTSASGARPAADSVLPKLNP
jgi:dienelactone hydrolase